VTVTCTHPSFSRKDNDLPSLRTLAALCACLLWCCIVPSAHAQEKKAPAGKDSAELVGRWVITQTKEPGKPYRESYKGRPFVMEGPNSFTLIMEYRRDGTFRRISRVAGKDTVQEGTWKLSGHELRHKRKGQPVDEVMYIRFDGADEFTSTEVYEDTLDPGLFAKFKRLPQG
jgi:hypothetical protein